MTLGTIDPFKITWLNWLVPAKVSFGGINSQDWLTYTPSAPRTQYIDKLMTENYEMGDN